MDIIIYSNFHSPRLEYICHQVFNIWFKLDYLITNQLDIYRQFKGGRVNYSENKICEREIFLPCSFLLKENSIQKFKPHIFEYNKIPALFKIEKSKATIPLDVFATIFFHLSRYEEYLPFNSDQHGRFPATQSWAFQQNSLHLPVVDLLLKELQKQLLLQFPQLSFPKRILEKQLTYDIDMAWAYQHKGYLRSIGGFLKHISNREWASLKKRSSVLLGKRQDPFQTFELLDNWNQQYEVQATYFFLLGNHSTFDKNTPHSKPVFKRLIKKIAQQYPVGIHPSYQSNHQKDLLGKEIRRLASITKQAVYKSRQHFLKLQFPTTYRQLIQHNITDDYSMGYAAHLGFRAGTSRPFYWYDLKKEERTNLLIHPFQVMDVTLKEYLQLSPEQAMAKISNLMETLCSVEGVFCSIWHNSSFSYVDDWEDWFRVYEYLLSAK